MGFSSFMLCFLGSVVLCFYCAINKLKTASILSYTDGVSFFVKIVMRNDEQCYQES